MAGVRNVDRARRILGVIRCDAKFVVEIAFLVNNADTGVCYLGAEISGIHFFRDVGYVVCCEGSIKGGLRFGRFNHRDRVAPGLDQSLFRRILRSWRRLVLYDQQNRSSAIRCGHGPGVVIRGVAITITLGRGLRRIAGSGVVHSGSEINAGEILAGRGIRIEQHSNFAAGRYLRRQVDADVVTGGIIGVSDPAAIDLHTSDRRCADACRHRDRYPVYAGVVAGNIRLDVVAE